MLITYLAPLPGLAVLSSTRAKKHVVRSAVNGTVDLQCRLSSGTNPAVRCVVCGLGQVAGTDPCLSARQPDPPMPGRTDALVNGCPVRAARCPEYSME